MTQPAPVPFLRAYTPQELHAALRDRCTGLRRELAVEMAARARAEAEADEARDLLLEVQRRLRAEERVTRRLRRALASRLLRGAAPFALAGLAAGFGATILLRLGGF
jgi:hypothetical protein